MGEIIKDFILIDLEIVNLYNIIRYSNMWKRRYGI